MESVEIDRLVVKTMADILKHVRWDRECRDLIVDGKGLDVLKDAFMQLLNRRQP